MLYGLVVAEPCIRSIEGDDIHTYISVVHRHLDNLFLGYTLRLTLLNLPYSNPSHGVYYSSCCFGTYISCQRQLVDMSREEVPVGSKPY